jgi:hypothetical protein
MGSVAVSLPKPKINLGDLLKVVGLPTERERETRIPDSAGDLVREVVAVIDGLISTSIEQHTAEAFCETREIVFPQYCAAVRALGDLARIVLPKHTIDRMSIESFAVMESDFRELGGATFGADLTERGLFTAWTLRKIYDLGQEISASPQPKENAKEDTELARGFVRMALWNRFHLDCLTKSMRAGKPLYPEVIDPIRDGLRAAVDAYAAIRQWADLRNPSRPETMDFASLEWTNDDEVLLSDSMRDLDLESA